MGSIEESRSVRAALIVAALGAAACSKPPVYWPNASPAPRVLERGDAHASVHASAEGFAHVQAAVAVTNHWAVVASATQGTFRSCSVCDRRTSRFAEVSTGPFYISETGRSVTWLFGAGAGTTDWLGGDFGPTTNLITRRRATGAVRRGFVQVSSVERGYKYDVAAAIRLSAVGVTGYGLFAKDTAFGSTTFDRPLPFKGRPWSLFLEPSIGLSFHFGPVRVGPQLGCSVSLLPPPRFGHRPGLLTLGVQLGAQ